jgi:hypothetical protein
VASWLQRLVRHQPKQCEELPRDGDGFADVAPNLDEPSSELRQIEEGERTDGGVDLGGPGKQATEAARSNGFALRTTRESGLHDGGYPRFVSARMFGDQAEPHDARGRGRIHLAEDGPERATDLRASRAGEAHLVEEQAHIRARGLLGREAPPFAPLAEPFRVTTSFARGRHR